MSIKEKIKQIKYKFKEFRVIIKNWFAIPKGLRRMLIELIIVIGQLTHLYLIDSDSEEADKLFINILSIYSSRMEKIEEYIKFIKDGNI